MQGLLGLAAAAPRASMLPQPASWNRPISTHTSTILPFFKSRFPAAALQQRSHSLHSHVLTALELHGSV